MTNRKMITFTLALILCMMSSFWFATFSFGEQALPKPGQVINHSNYKKYAHLFCPEFLQGFKDGFGGLIKPFSITVTATEPALPPKVFLEASAKNRGKFSVDSNGDITGGYNFVGYPFPDLKRSDKDFTTKLMWNYNYRYQFDTSVQPCIAYSKRKGEPATWTTGTFYWMYFANRMFDLPKPLYKTPIGLYKACIMKYSSPVSLKNTMLLTYRFLDTKKSDETFIYLPTMRRVLRGDAGQRSTPLQGSIQAPDDFYLFDGRIPDFTYKLVGEQKVLAVADGKFDATRAKKLHAEGIQVPYPNEDYELRDVYVIDIIPKDPRYPQGRKRIYIDKQNYSAYYATAYDRAGKVWKMWTASYTKCPQPHGKPIAATLTGVFGVDVQFGMAASSAMNVKVNGHDMSYSQFMPDSLLRMVQ